MRISSLAFCVLLSAACDSATRPDESAGFVAIDPAVGAYHAGEQLRATITNLSSQPMQFSVCFARFERQVKGGGWALIYADQNPCPAVLVILKGYGSTEARVDLPAGLSSGTYRIRFPAIGRPASDQGPVVEAAQLGGVFTLRP